MSLQNPLVFWGITRNNLAACKPAGVVIEEMIRSVKPEGRERFMRAIKRRLQTRDIFSIFSWKIIN
jgi:hypothetical protein